MEKIIPVFKNIELGVHLHSAPENRIEKLEAAFNAGCRRFDSALKGIGGCPMAGNDLVGNMDTETMLQYFQERGEMLHIDNIALKKCGQMANEIFI